jgi:DNA-binding Lrp family transcriptional regulator
MTTDSSEQAAVAASEPKSIRPDGADGAGGADGVSGGGTPHTPSGRLDETDRKILRELARDARLPNNTLAQLAGIAPSTCLARVRVLRERGVIRGYHAEIDPAALGLPLQAMVAVRLQGGARGHLRSFVAGMARLPEVLNIFFLAGKDDFLLHVAAASSEALRDFVERLSSNADVAYTETSLIFEHIRANQGML